MFVVTAMDFKYKLITVAVLALLSETAFAAPMLIVPLDVKPYPHVSEGLRFKSS